MKAMTWVMIAASMLIVQTAEARSYTRPAANHLYNQHQRIRSGVRTGQLTPREANSLRMQQVKVKSYKQMAMADGRVTHDERRMIMQAQKHANRSIYHKKHNNRARCHR